ncbi:hypothetical protein M0802_000366 [Mischocyttarus mexicanus]|nr:hypothetical protein M0802_000366 [Mischocyttarus mexicanus]
MQKTLRKEEESTGGFRITKQYHNSNSSVQVFSFCISSVAYLHGLRRTFLPEAFGFSGSSRGTELIVRQCIKTPKGIRASLIYSHDERQALSIVILLKQIKLGEAEEEKKENVEKEEDEEDEKEEKEEEEEEEGKE